MPAWSIHARPPRRGPAQGDGEPGVTRDPDVLAAWLEDAAHFPGGYTAGLVTAESEADIAAILRTPLSSSTGVLIVSAQSSLTGGATPRGELLVSMAHLNRVIEAGTRSVRVGAGLTLADLDERLRQTGGYYPPVPTFLGAFVGGTVATNAAGAATFKYGSTRDWVEALTIVLPTGDVLDVQRGAVHAHPDGYFEIVRSDGVVRVPVPTYTMPKVAKTSAGYFAAPGMDLIDLFIGSEGTLGVVTEVALRVLPARPAACLAFVPFREEGVALAFVRQLCESARATWETPVAGSARGLDVAAIEHMDRRCLALLREDGVDRRLGVGWPDDTAMALLVTLELPAATRPEDAFAEIGLAREAGAPDTPIVRFCRALDAAGVLDDVEIAVPGDWRRAAQLLELREAVPAGVNQRVGRAKAAIDGRIQKMAADMIVPMAHVEALLSSYTEVFGRRGLDVAVWGHISDGNVHPNVIPRSLADVEAGKDAILELGRQVIRLGGSPLAEHGVGRNPIKQQLLRELYGDEGIEEMRRVKHALDPEWTLAPGVLFPRERSG